MREFMVTNPAAALDRTRDTLTALQDLKAFVQSSNIKLASEKIFVLSGIGGSGKTHSICDIAIQRLEAKLFSCIVFGDQFSGNPDEWTRFGEALNLRNVSSDQLLDALNAAAEQSGKPLIVFIDAINETIRRDYWTSRIAAFADDIAKRPFLKLCISCRSSFLLTSLPTPNPFLTIEHTGFKGFERIACNAFFTFYGLIPPPIPVLQPELGNPLYLKLVCETMKAKKLEQLPAGWIGLQPVIRAFLLEKERQLCQRYELSPSGALTVTALTAIIQEITNKAEASLSWTDATAAVVKVNPPIPPSQLLDWLVKADLLIEDGSVNNQGLADITFVRPAFERLGDFLLGAEIAKQAMPKGTETFLAHHKAQEVFRDEASINYNASLVAALSVILPENYDIELPTFFNGSPLYETVAAIATKAVIWRTPESLTYETRDFLKATLHQDGCIAMDALFSICANASKVDATWLSEILSATPLADRDAFFAGYLYTSYNDKGIIRKLIEAYRDLDLAHIDTNAAYRWLIALIWLTAAPDRRIKDTATRAAVAILQHHNQLATNLVDDLMHINDEEVVEHLLLIIYGAQIESPDHKALEQVVARIVDNYADAPWAFQNALIRDHIRCIAEMAEYLGCLPKSIDPMISMQTSMEEGWSLQVPDDGITDEWQSERGARKLAAASAISDDFNHYSIDCLKHWQKNLTKKDIGKWIIADVINRKGLDDTLHNFYDITVVRETGGGRSKPAYAERLGKKYQWKALYRLASILHDKVERKTNSQPDFVRPPLILQDERRMDPTLTQPYFSSGSPLKNWWLQGKPDLHSTENIDAGSWLEHQGDIPSMRKIIAVTPRDGQNWIPLSMSASFDTSKKQDGYGSSYRSMNLLLDTFLVKDTNLERMIKRLDGKNLYTCSLPPGGNFSHCYLGEYPWATACNTFPDWYLDVGNTFGGTRIEMHNTTSDIIAEYEYDYTLAEHMYVQVPCKKFFEPGDLWWNGMDGYSRADGKTVFIDPRISTGGQQALIADYEDLTSRLNKLGYCIVWAFRGEKMLINHQLTKDRKYFSQIAWMDSHGALFFGKRMFFQSYDSKRGISEQVESTAKIPRKNALSKAEVKNPTEKSPPNKRSKKT